MNKEKYMPRKPTIFMDIGFERTGDSWGRSKGWRWQEQCHCNCRCHCVTINFLWDWHCYLVAVIQFLLLFFSFSIWQIFIVRFVIISVKLLLCNRNRHYHYYCHHHRHCETFLRQMESPIIPRTMPKTSIPRPKKMNWEQQTLQNRDVRLFWSDHLPMLTLI